MTPEEAAAKNKEKYEELLAEKEAREAGEEIGEESEGGEQGDAGENSFSPEQLAKLHDKMDKNGDGKVSIQEVAEFNDHIDKEMANKDTPQIFGEFDKDGDGKVSMDEYVSEEPPVVDIEAMEGSEDDVEAENAREAEHIEMQRKMFKAADHDGDDLLNVDEFRGLIHPETNHKVLIETVKMVMKEKDVDKSGKLSMAEFFERHDDQPEDAEGDDDMKEALDEMQKQEKKNFEWLDKDKDGHLDLHEVLRWESGESNLHQSWDAVFAFTDKDKDGHITKKEFVDAHPSIIDSEAHNTMQFWNEHLEL